MNKYIFGFLFFLLLLLAGCSSDEFHWKNVDVQDDEYLIAFSTSDYVFRTITRDSEETIYNIENLYLLMFKDGALAKAQVYLSNDDRLSTPSSNSEHLGSIKDRKENFVSGHWFLVANAKDEIDAFLNGKKDETSGTYKGVSEQDFLNSISIQTSDHTKDKPVLVSGCTDVNIESLAQPYASILILEHIQANITVSVSTNNMPFLVTGITLYGHSDQSGSLAGTVLAPNPSTMSTEPEFFSWQPNSSDVASIFSGKTKDKEGNIISHLKTGDLVETMTYPCSTPDMETDNNKRIMMIIRGNYDQGNVSSEEDENEDFEFQTGDYCYYAVPMPALLANHKYQMRIESVSAKGSPTISEAIESTSGLVVKFEDSTESIRDIISDGENVLAVQDTLKINPSENETQSLQIKARIKGDSSPSIIIDCIDADGNPREFPSWIESHDLISSTPVTNGNYTTASIALRIKASKNNGAERIAYFRVTLEGTDLTRKVSVVQRATDDIDYSRLMDIKLQIYRGSELKETIEDYIAFINPEITTRKIDSHLLGITPEENGGRRRNLGLHLPMPNGGNTRYVYTITLKNQSEIIFGSHAAEPYKNDAIYTYSFTDGSDYKYYTWPNEIEVKNGEYNLTLDLYHTGFFHKDKGVWYYYEVFTQDNSNNNLHWLDRNLGATSAGMGVRRLDETTTFDTWPLVGDKAFGNLYKYSEAVEACPPGWNLPSYAQIRSMTTQQQFSIDPFYSNKLGRPYYAPAYLFSGKEGGQGVSYRSYFPQNRMKIADTGNYGGEEAAGYYLTNTSAGADGWFQIVKFLGKNVTSENRKVNGQSDFFRLSARCCAGSFNPSIDGIQYKCNVYGFTHVFLYYKNPNDDSKTYLTTWPGEQIAVADDINRYHPFKLTSNMDYGIENLYVIFNTVRNGKVTDSNVFTSNITSRNGISFRNGGNYDINAKPACDGAIKGNWVDLPPATKTVAFRWPKYYNGKEYKSLYIWFNNNDYIGDAFINNLDNGEIKGDCYYKKIEISTADAERLKQFQGDKTKFLIYNDDNNKTNDFGFAGKYVTLSSYEDFDGQYPGCDYYYSLLGASSSESDFYYQIVNYGNYKPNIFSSYETFEKMTKEGNEWKASNMELYKGNFKIEKYRNGFIHEVIGSAQDDTSTYSGVGHNCSFNNIAFWLPQDGSWEFRYNPGSQSITCTKNGPAIYVFGDFADNWTSNPKDNKDYRMKTENNEIFKLSVTSNGYKKYFRLYIDSQDWGVLENDVQLGSSTSKNKLVQVDNNSSKKALFHDFGQGSTIVIVFNYSTKEIWYE